MKTNPQGKGKVAHITTVHRPFDTRIFHKQAVSLADAGYEVTLIQRGDRDETVKGVRILALPTAKNRLDRVSRVLWRAFSLARQSGARTFHLHDPELLPVGLLLKAMGRTVVYDVHEELALFDDRAHIPRWMRRPLALAVGLLEWLANRVFDGIVAATPLIAEQFSPDRVVLVRNTPRADELAECGAIPFSQRPRNAFYAGGMAFYSGVDLMVAAMSRLPATPPSYLVLGGEFPSEAEQRRIMAMPGAKQVTYLGWLDRPSLTSAMGCVRAGMVLYRRTENVLRSDPIKLYEMMGAGLPVVVADVPRWRGLIEGNDCGILVDPEDADACARALDQLLSNPEAAEAMGRRARETILTQYEWSIDEARLLGLYARLDARRPTRP